MKIEFNDTLIFDKKLIKKIRKIQNKILVVERLLGKEQIIIYDEAWRLK
jgi:hypothetical protein